MENTNTLKMASTPATGKPREWFQILAICTGCLMSFTTGLFFSWPSPSIPNLTAENGPYRFTLEQCSYLAVISSLSMAIASLCPGVFIDNLGRRRTLLFMSTFYIVAAILNVIADRHNIYVFYLGRVFSGTGDAFLFATVPVYIGEISTPKVRGTWGNMNSVNIFMGQFAINVVGGYYDVKTTAWFCLTVPVLFLCTFFYMPESPYFYVMIGQLENARKSLRQLRRIYDVEEELLALEAAVKRQMSESSSWKDLFLIDSNRKPTIAIIFMRISQQTAGYATFSVYAKYIFQKAAGSVSPTESAIIYTGAVCLLSLFGSYVMDKMGRRMAMMSTMLAASVILGGLAVYFYVDVFCTDLDLQDFKFVPLVGMLLYVITWSTGFGIVANLMLGELFSTAMKGKGLCVANIAFGLSICAMSKLFQVLEVSFGLYFPFAFFSVCTFINSALMYFFVPETKGKTLEEIQLEFKTEKCVQ